VYIQSTVDERKSSMRKTYILLSLLLCFAINVPLTAEHRRDHIRISTPDETTMLSTLSLGLDVILTKPGKCVEALVSPDELNDLRSKGIAFTVVRENLGRFLAERNRLTPGLTMEFGDGSIGGYYSYSEMISILDSLITNDPNTITAGLDTIGYSHYGRPVVMFTVSDNPDLNEGEPEVFYNGIHHAREPMGMMNLIYFLEHLIDNYGSSPEITYLVDNRKLWFVPIVNPDGYAINESIYVNTSDFGFWRKNALDNNSNGYIDDDDGVDLNRNYGYMWGYDDIGSSPNPTSGIYRGPSPFSEPETSAIKTLCESRLFMFCLNYHQHGNLLINPYGYNNTETPDSLIFREIGDNLTEFNNYMFGTAVQTINYFTNGGAADWMYGEQVTKEKIFAMIPEIGSNTDNFWPPQERILPLAEENLYPNIFLAYAAGFHVIFADFFELDDSAGDDDGYPDEGEDINVTVTLKNVGVSLDATNISCELSTANPAVTVTKAAANFDDALIGQEVDNNADPFTIQIGESFTPGEIATLYLSISADGGYMNTDSLDILLGTPDIVFYDGAEGGMVNFTSTIWEASPQHVSQGLFAFTDSPTGNYPSNANSIMTGTVQLDLSNAANAYLFYDSRWEIENDYDWGQVEISRDGSTWMPMEATSTFPGTGQSPFHDPDEEGYHARQLIHIRERVDLIEFTGPSNETVSLRFVLRSDGGLQFDGWYLDEISVLAYGPPAGIGDGLTPGRVPFAFGLGQNYPNPFNPQTTISFVVPGDGKETVQTKLAIYDVRGRLIRILADRPLSPGNHNLTWDGRSETGASAGSGVYIYRLESGEQNTTRKMVLVK